MMGRNESFSECLYINNENWRPKDRKKEEFHLKRMLNDSKSIPKNQHQISMQNMDQNESKSTDIPEIVNSQGKSSFLVEDIDLIKKKAI